MPAIDSSAAIVARFLKANDYNRTLQAFIDEANLPPDAGNSSSKDELTIEQILEEKRLFDLSMKYEKHSVEETTKWKNPAPSQPTVIPLPEATNILSVDVQPIYVTRDAPTISLLVTTAGRRVNIVKADSSFSLVETLSPQDSPILSWTQIYDGRISCGTAMSGQIILFDNATKTVLSERRDHTKYAIKAATSIDPQSQALYLATAGWDAKVYLYLLPAAFSQTTALLAAPVASLELPSKPEDILFHSCPTPSDPQRLVLIVTRRDSTQLHYYAVTPPHSPSRSITSSFLTFLGSQNLAPHAMAWSSFSCSCVVPCPTDPTLVAVATSTIPSLKLIIARLLVPSSALSSGQGVSHDHVPVATATLTPGSEDHTQASLARAQLAEQDRFAAAVVLHVSIQAPQTPYSTPRVTWRPDGSGVWVNGDDGVVRGVERSTGKVVSLLKGGHEVAKVRDLWAGWVDVEGRKEEWVVTGGFDRRLVVWRVEE